MAGQRDENEEEMSPAEQMRGVETFDTEELVLLVLGDVEQVATELARLRNATAHERDVLGRKVSISAPSWLVLRLAGHPWSVVADCTGSPNARLLPADAAALSKALKTKAIYFANSDCASFTEYELFEKGQSREHFRLADEVEFTSAARRVPPPEDGPDVYTFVDAFMREQDAYVPACSLEFNTGSMTAGKKAELLPEDELDEEDVERIDYVAGAKPAK